MSSDNEPKTEDPYISADQKNRHKWYEDIQAVLFGAFFIGVAISFYKDSMLLTGGIYGLSLVLSYVTSVDFGAYFFFLNMPFYLLAIMRMGWRFTLKTVAAVAFVSVFPKYVPEFFLIEMVHPAFAAIFGGCLVAMGMIALFRHGSGIGGVSILAHFLQERKIVRAGLFLLGVDLLILAGAAFVLPLPNLLYSVLGAVVLNLFVAINHKPGRYFGK